MKIEQFADPLAMCGSLPHPAPVRGRALRFRVKTTTMRVADGEPGVECQIDFAQLGVLLDPETGRRRRVHVLIFTAVLSRHMARTAPAEREHLQVSV